MEKFDFELHRVFGLVEDKFGDNATIDVLGYCDENFHISNHLSQSEIIEMFPNRGKVFAPKFSHYHENLKGKIVCLCVRQSNNDGPEKYVWDWNGEVVEFGRRIYTIKAVFSNDGQSNYDILKNNNLLDADEERLIYCENRIYQFNPNSDERVIKFWEVSSLYIETIDGIKYCIGTSFPKHDGLLDITNDDQLANWYLSKVVKKNWAEITQCKSFRNLEGFLVELLATLKNLDEPTLQSRLNRLRRINSSLSISFESLKEISEAPWFGDVVRKSIAEERVQLLEYLSKENDTELKKIKEGYSLELLRLEEEQSKEINELRQKFDETLNIFYEKECAVEKRLQEKSIELDLLDESANEKKLLLTTLENSIATLNERKTSIIQDFSVIKEVLNATSKTALQDERTIAKDFFLEEIAFSEKPIVRFQAYVKSLENILKANGIYKGTSLAMGKMLVKYNVVICPSLSIAQALIFASHRCKYLTEYVSAKWESFRDLWENGLAYIVSKSMEDTETMHFLLLQNINISYLPNFMQPLVDLQKGLITKFPVSNIPWPRNLRILCTITEEELITMPASVLRYFGCIDKSLSSELYVSMKFADDAGLGYLMPTCLNCEDESYADVQNMFEQYIDE